MTDEPASERPPTAASDVAWVCGGVTLATGLVITFAFDPDRAGTAAMLLAMGGLYVVIATYAVFRIRRAGELRAFRPAPGDIWLGGLTAGVLYGGAMLSHLVLAPHGSPQEGWLARLYLQLGDPRGEGHDLAGGAVFVIAALEEIIWRGLVMRSLRDVTSGPRAVVVTAILFTIAHVPTAVLLRDPIAGLNPLVVLAALGCSIVWGAMVLRTGRLVPAIIAHALFSWFVVEFPVWRL